jgi:hypothetical protein
VKIKNNVGASIYISAPALHDFVANRAVPLTLAFSPAHLHPIVGFDGRRHRRGSLHSAPGRVPTDGGVE